MATLAEPFRVCIIGAGPSGLTAIKTCLEERLEPVCYEKTNNFGGLWRYRNEDEEGIPSVMKSTIINSSKELSAFSDFPPASELSNFMHNTSVVKYLEDYMKAFDLAKYIKYNQTILSVVYAKDYDTSGKWLVRVQEKDKQPREETFNAVLVCIGHHVFPHSPDFPGLRDFEGTKVHTHSYKVPNSYEDKNVLIIGIGNSGGDVSVEMSRFAKKAYLSTRRGSWVINRVGHKGYPTDIILVNRFNLFMKSIAPWSLINTVIEVVLNSRFDHARYGLKPKHRVFEQHVMVNDEMPNRIASGTLVIKDDVDHFTKNCVVFKGELDVEYPIDAIILATGYDIKFPILGDDIVSVKENQMSLYKNVFPPQLKHPTLAIIGLIQPLGSILPISEMQCRWAAAVFQGARRLPEPSVMLQDIQETKELLKKRFVPTQRHTIQVDYIEYMDSIANMIGAKPNLTKTFFSDPRLFFTMYFGPCYPYQYRLNGPRPWAGATNAILTGEKRILTALETRQNDDLQTEKPYFIVRLFLAGCFLFQLFLTIISLTFT